MAQFVAHAAFRHQRQSEARLGQALLRRQAVDQGDVGSLQPRPDQLACEDMAGRIALIGRRRKADPAFAFQHPCVTHAASGQAMTGRGDDQHRLATGLQRDEFRSIAGEIAQTERGLAATDQVSDLGARGGAELERTSFERRAKRRSTSTMWVSARVPTRASEMAPRMPVLRPCTASRPSLSAASAASAWGRKAWPPRSAGRGRGCARTSARRVLPPGGRGGG